MADVSKIKLPNGTTYNIKDERLPSATSIDEGKIVAVNSTGSYVVTEAPGNANAYVTDTTLVINTSVTNGDPP